MASIYLMILTVVAVIGWGVWVALEWRQTRAFALDVLEARKADGDLPDSVSPDVFVPLFARSEGPRKATYLFFCAAITTVFLAPFISAVNTVWRAIWRVTGADPIFEVGTLLHTFSLFVIVMGGMVALLAAALRRYYALMPPSLKQVIRDLNAS